MRQQSAQKKHFRHIPHPQCGNRRRKTQIRVPGILRAMLIETEEKQEDKICKLEANIDDSIGEQLGYVLGALMEAVQEMCITPLYT